MKAEYLNNIILLIKSDLLMVYPALLHEIIDNLKPTNYSYLKKEGSPTQHNNPSPKRTESSFQTRKFFFNYNYKLLLIYLFFIIQH